MHKLIPLAATALALTSCRFTYITDPFTKPKHHEYAAALATKCDGPAHRVPDSGSTIILLTGALAALGTARRFIV